MSCSCVTRSLYTIMCAFNRSVKQSRLHASSDQRMRALIRSDKRSSTKAPRRRLQLPADPAVARLQPLSSEAERGAAEANRVESRCHGCGGWREKWYTASDLRNNAALLGPRGLPAALARTSTDSLSWDSCAELRACRSVSGRRGAAFGMIPMLFPMARSGGIGFSSFDACRRWATHRLTDAASHDAT